MVGQVTYLKMSGLRPSSYSWNSSWCYSCAALHFDEELSVVTDFDQDQENWAESRRDPTEKPDSATSAEPVAAADIEDGSDSDDYYNFPSGDLSSLTRFYCQLGDGG